MMMPTPDYVCKYDIKLGGGGGEGRGAGYSLTYSVNCQLSTTSLRIILRR